MDSSRFRITAFSILVVAAILRFWDIGLKPPHFDEGINGWFAERIAEEGHFRYDPTNYHGPLHFYVVFAAQSLFGRSIEALRFPVALVGLGCVWVALFGYRRHLGERAALFFGTFLAISPAMVFVSRYAIHEIWLLFFCMLTALGVLDLSTRRLQSGVWLLWTGVFGMVLTKETYVIHLLAFLLAYPTLLLTQRYIFPDSPQPLNTGQHDKLDLVSFCRASLPAFTLGLLLVLYFYSGNFHYFRGLSGLWTTFFAWSETGMEASGHEKPFYYWFQLFLRYEWAALLGILASARFILPSPGPLRWLVISGAGAAVAYAIIPYKTPWCVIMVMWTFPLALAWVLDEGCKQARWALPTIILFSVTGLHAIGMSVWLNFFHFDNPREPYVYVQTHREIHRFLDPLLESAERNPLLYHQAGAILEQSPFPLPWLLGDFPMVGYYAPDTALSPFDHTFYLSPLSRISEVEPRLKGDWFVVEFPLRDSQERYMAFFDANWYADAFAAQSPVRFPRKEPLQP